MTRTIYRHGESSSFASPYTSSLQGLTEVDHALADRAFTWPVSASTFYSARNTQIICIARFYNCRLAFRNCTRPRMGGPRPPASSGLNRDEPLRLTGVGFGELAV